MQIENNIILSPSTVKGHCYDTFFFVLKVCDKTDLYLKENAFTDLRS